MVTSSTSSSYQAGWWGTKKAEALDDILRHLSIYEEEIDDLEEEEKDDPKEGMKWFALARVHTGNHFSVQTFEQHMKVAWIP
jgi:hypothetical protein